LRGGKAYSCVAFEMLGQAAVNMLAAFTLTCGLITQTQADKVEIRARGHVCGDHWHIGCERTHAGVVSSVIRSTSKSQKVVVDTSGSIYRVDNALPLRQHKDSSAISTVRTSFPLPMKCKTEQPVVAHLNGSVFYSFLSWETNGSRLELEDAGNSKYYMKYKAGVMWYLKFYSSDMANSIGFMRNHDEASMFKVINKGLNSSGLSLSVDRVNNSEVHPGFWNFTTDDGALACTDVPEHLQT